MSEEAPTRRAALARAAALALTALLAACGRKDRPQPPPDADPAAPRRYPTR